MFDNIETKRLLLKNISLEDNEFILSHFSDSFVNKYLFDAEPISNLKEANDLIEFFTQPEPRTMHRWILVRKSDNKKIGTCGFHCWNPYNRCTDIGYDLEETYCGKGYMTDALSAIIPFACEYMKIRHIEAHIYTENDKSIKLAEKFGFVFSGKTEICIFKGNEYLHKIYVLKI
jgi:ribosomal-protein-alanine N-acetyltransferase